MKVKQCERCEKYERRVWSQYYEPRNYHPIGMSHAYGYCKRYKIRCLLVKKCYKEVSKNGKTT